MSEILEILESLAAQKGRNKKVEILKSLGTNEADFKIIAVAAYDPAVNYYVRNWPKPDSHAKEATLTWPVIVAMLSTLSSRQLTGNAAIEYLTATEAKLTPEQAEVFTRIVGRDLKCGATASTFNTVWPKLIAEHPYMRCSSFNKKNLAKIKLPCQSQTKADGLYVDIIVTDSVGTATVVYKSRTGEVKAFGSSKDDAFREYPGTVFMGEALVLDENGVVMSRKEGNGYLNGSDIDGDRIRFVLWDIVPIDAFEAGVCKIPYVQRLARLKTVVANMGEANINIVNTRHVADITEIIDHFKEEVGAGEEGTVVKNLSAIWKDGTSADQVKMKLSFDVEVKVVGYEEGTGKYKGMLGALNCESEDGLVIVSAGGGFTDKQRTEFFTDSIVGAVVTVRANDVISNRNKPGVWSLFLPRFVELRTDKVVADTYERIVEQRDSFTDTLSAIK